MLSWIWWIMNRVCWQFQSFRDLTHGMQLVAKKSWKLVGVTRTRVPTCLLKGSGTPGWCMGWSQMSTNLLCSKMEYECASQNIPREFDHLTLGMSSLRVPGRDCLWSTRLFFGFRCLPTIRTLHAWHWQFAVMLSNPFLQSHFQWDGVHCVELKFGWSVEVLLASMSFWCQIFSTRLFEQSVLPWSVWPGFFFCVQVASSRFRFPCALSVLSLKFRLLESGTSCSTQVQGSFIWN